MMNPGRPIAWMLAAAALALGGACEPPDGAEDAAVDAVGDAQVFHDPDVAATCDAGPPCDIVCVTECGGTEFVKPLCSWTEPPACPAGSVDRASCPACEGEAPFKCAQSCQHAASWFADCTGEWICLSGVDLTECEGPCVGGPAFDCVHCDQLGLGPPPTCGELGWECAEGLTPATECPPNSCGTALGSGCVATCAEDSGIWGETCEDGWISCGDGFDLQRCTCWGQPELACRCPVDMVPTVAKDACLPFECETSADLLAASISALAAAGPACQQDADCLAAVVNTDCGSGCPVAVHADYQGAFQDSLADLSGAYCRPEFVSVCGVDSASCAAAEARCLDGACAMVEVTP